MTIEPVLTLLLVAVIANLVVMGVVLLPPMLGKRSPLPFGRQIEDGDRAAAEYAAVRGDSPGFIDLDGVPSTGGSAGTYRPLPVMPAMEVDLALIVPDSVTSAQVAETIRESAGDLLESLTVFDEFRGAGIPEASRSLAWRLTFRHPERTLRDREVQGRTAKILSTLEAALGIRQRTS